MRGRLTIAAILLCATVAVGAAASASPAHARTLAPDCQSKLRFKPHSLILFCADAGAVAQKVHWYRWGRREARGRSRRVVVNTCDPSCAEGGARRYRARFVLRRARRCPAKGRQVFTRLTVIFDGKRKPRGLSKFTQRLFCGS